MKLNSYLFVGFFSLVLLVGVSDYLTANQAETIMRNELGQDNVLLAEHGVEHILSSVNEKSYELDIFLHDEDIVNGLVKSNKRFATMENREEYIASVDQKWKAGEILAETYNISRNNLSKELSKIQEFYAQEEGKFCFGEIIIANRYGVVQGFTDKTTDYYQMDESWWNKTVEEGFCVQGLAYDESSEVYGVVLCQEISDKQGNLIGVAKSILDLNFVLEPMLTIEIEDSPEKLTYEIIEKDTGYVSAIANETGTFTFPIGSEKHEAFEQIKENGLEGYVYYESNGVEHLLGYSEFNKYTKLKNLDFILAVSQDTEVIFEPLTGLKTNLGIVTFSMLVVSTLIVLFTSRKLTEPIEELTEKVKRISKGELDIGLGSSDIPEIKSLIDSLSRVLASMKLAILRTGVTKTQLGLEEAVKAKKEAEKKAKQKEKQLIRFAKLAEGREMKMIQLKKKVKQLEEKLAKSKLRKKKTKKTPKSKRSKK